MHSDSCHYISPQINLAVKIISRASDQPLILNKNGEGEPRGNKKKRYEDTKFPLEKKNIKHFLLEKYCETKTCNVARTLSSVALSHHKTLSLDHKVASQNFKVPIGKSPLTQLVEVLLCLELREAAFRTTQLIQVATPCRSWPVKVWGFTKKSSVSARRAKLTLPCEEWKLRQGPQQATEHGEKL